MFEVWLSDGRLTEKYHSNADSDSELQVQYLPIQLSCIAREARKRLVNDLNRLVHEPDLHAQYSIEVIFIVSVCNFFNVQVPTVQKWAL